MCIAKRVVPFFIPVTNSIRKKNNFKQTSKMHTITLKYYCFIFIRRVCHNCGIVTRALSSGLFLPVEPRTLSRFFGHCHYHEIASLSNFKTVYNNTKQTSTTIHDSVTDNHFVIFLNYNIFLR